MLAEIVDKAVTALGSDDKAAHWFGAYNFDLGGRPIVLCESEAGRRDVLAFVEANPASWYTTTAWPGQHA